VPTSSRHFGEIDRRFAEYVDPAVHHTVLPVPVLPVPLVRHVALDNRRTGCVPLQIERDRSGMSVRTSECVVRIVERRGMGLVADGPLGHRIEALVLSPQCFTFQDERVGADGNLVVGDVQQRAVGSGQRRPVPGRAPDDAVAGDDTEPCIGGPSREHPLLDDGQRVATIVQLAAGSVRVGHHRADYATMIRYLSLEWLDALSAEVAANDRLRDLAGTHSVNITQVVRRGPEGDVTYHLAVGDGQASFGAGPADNEDVRMEQDWTTAVAVATGELNAQQAFISGQILLFGDHQKLLDAQPVFGALDSVFTTVRERTRYE
jgi:hypothetical protein